MSGENLTGIQERTDSEKATLGRNLTTAGWGFVFIWIGIVLLTQLSGGVALLGIGIIIIAMQIIRMRMNLRIELFRFIVGLFFVAGGIWDLYNTNLNLLPSLCFLAGAIFLVASLLGLQRN